MFRVMESESKMYSEEEVRDVLENIKSMVLLEGGYIEFLGMDAEGIVRLKIQGACETCPSASGELKRDIERMLCEQIPEIQKIIAV